MADDYQLRRRINPGQKATDLVIGHEGRVESQGVGNEVSAPESVSNTSGIANHKAKIFKTENLPPSSANYPEKMKAMRILLAEAQQLTEAEKMHTERAQQLDNQIKQGEIEYGQMLQHVLKLQRALALKKKHIDEDKEAREKELSSKRSKTEVLRLAITRLNELAGDENDGPSSSKSKDPSAYA